MKSSAALSAQARSSITIVRRRSSASLALGIAILTAATLLPTTAEAACRGGFCVSGHDVYGGGTNNSDGYAHVVDFTTTWTNISHFNWFDPFNGQQYEIGANERQFSFPDLPSGTVEQFAIQACSGGGTFSRSHCGPWAYFTHTAP